MRAKSIEALRESNNSWSTRMASVQRAQFAQWQREYAESQSTPPTSVERARAWLGMEKNALMRRVAYRILKTKGAFESR